MYINGRVRPTIRILCKNRNFESLPNTSLIDGIEVATSLTENFQVFILLVFWNSLLKMRSNNRKLCEAVEFVNFCIDERCPYAEGGVLVGMIRVFRSEILSSKSNRVSFSMVLYFGWGVWILIWLTNIWISKIFCRM